MSMTDLCWNLVDRERESRILRINDYKVDYIFLSPARGFDRYALRANHPILQGYAFSG
ncbi:unnamed protein product [Prunus brigantina]